MTNSISNHTLIRPTSQAVACEIAGETVILDAPSGRYFALNAVGTVIWQRLQNPSTIASLCEELTREYDVTPLQCEAEVSALIQQLAAHHLVKFEE